MHVTEIRKSASRYGEPWLALHQVLAGSCMLQLSIYTCLDLYYTINAVSSSGVVVTCTLERILFLALAVTEINIKFETNIKKV